MLAGLFGRSPFLRLGLSSETGRNLDSMEFGLAFSNNRKGKLLVWGANNSQGDWFKRGNYSRTNQLALEQKLKLPFLFLGGEWEK